MTSEEVEIKRCAVNIDGLNLYNSALRDSSSRWLDIRKFAETLAEPEALVRVMYVTGRLSPQDSDDPDSPQRQRTYLKALDDSDGVDVVAHNFVVGTSPRVVSRGKSWHDRTDPPLPPRIADELDKIDQSGPKERRVMVRLPEEKMTDVALAVAMVNDYHLGQYTPNERIERTLLVANDSDYRPALEILAGLGHKIEVISPAKSVAKQLRDSRWRSGLLDPTVLKACELPDSFTAGGQSFTRPASWS